MRKMPKIRALLLAFAMLATALAPLAALADGGYETWYVCNPNQADRLHLRVGVDANELSLGKYYNGTPVTVLSKREGNWYKVRVGEEPAALDGWMMSKYLTQNKDGALIGRMPVVIAIQKATVYQLPDSGAKTMTIAKGRRMYVMGFGNGWRHLVVPTDDGGSYTCFAPEGAAGFVDVARVFVANPDKGDRLHLRAAPDKSAKSLGKYYNGAEGLAVGQSLDLAWTYVELYGRTGYMTNRYLFFDGQRNNTYYGVVDASVTYAATLYAKPATESRNALAQLSSGQRLKVYGVLEGWLHVLVDGTSQMGFIQTKNTDFVDDR